MTALPDADTDTDADAGAASTRACAQARSVFAQVVGPQFAALPPTVQALHTVRGRAVFVGVAQLRRGTHPLARLCALCTGLPPSVDDVAVTVEFEADERREVWRRRFGSARMHSRLYAGDGVLVERLGVMQFRFALHVADGALHWRTVGARLFGLLPLPAAWFAQVRCVEAERDGRYVFIADAALPLIGRVMRYEGWLAPR